MKNVDRIWNSMSSERKKRIEARATEEFKVTAIEHEEETTPIENTLEGDADESGGQSAGSGEIEGRIDSEAVG